MCSCSVKLLIALNKMSVLQLAFHRRVGKVLLLQVACLVRTVIRILIECGKFPIVGSLLLKVLVLKLVVKCTEDCRCDSKMTWNICRTWIGHRLVVGNILVAENEVLRCYERSAAVLKDDSYSVRSLCVINTFNICSLFALVEQMTMITTCSISTMA